MNSPIERRERQLEKAEKVRDFLGKTDSVKDLSARATLMHDRVADSVRDICSQDGGCFNDKQITILADIAVHIALLMDPSQKKPSGLWGRFWFEFRELGILARIGTLSGIIAVVIGVGTIATWTINGFIYGVKWYNEPEAAQIETPAEGSEESDPGAPAS